MFALGPASRAAFAGAALAAYAAAFAAAPIVARGSAAADALTAPPSPSPAPSPFAVVLPRRDPFAGGVPPLRRAAVGPPDPSAAATRSAYAGPAGLLVPFIAPGSPGMVPPSTVTLPSGVAGARVTAVATGTHASALVEENGATRMVRVGDALAGDRVGAIGTDGVRLERGTLLPLPRFTSTPPGGP